MWRKFKRLFYVPQHLQKSPWRDDFEFAWKQIKAAFVQ